MNQGAALGRLSRHLEALENNQKAFQVVLKLPEVDRKKQMGYLSQQLTDTIPTLVDETTSQKTAQTWLETWQELASDAAEFQVVLRLLNAAVQYKHAKDGKQHRRILLSLPAEERQILEELLSSTQSAELEA